MDQTRADRINNLHILRQRAFALNSAVSDHVKETFDLMETLVRNGTANHAKVGYQIQSFLTNSQVAQSNDPDAIDPLHSFIYGLTLSMATTFQSVFEDLGGPRQGARLQQLFHQAAGAGASMPMLQQQQQQQRPAAVDEQAEAESAASNESDQDQTLFLPFGFIKQEVVDNETEPAMLNFPSNAQLAAARLQLPSAHQQPLSSFDTQARFMSGELSPVASPLRQLMRYTDREEDDSDEEASWMRGSSRSSLMPPSAPRVKKPSGSVKFAPKHLIVGGPVAVVAPTLSTQSTPSPVPVVVGGKVACGHCNKTFSSVSRLKCHTTMMHKDKKVLKRAATASSTAAVAESFPCEQCGEPFTTLAGARRHFTRSHMSYRAAKLQSINAASSPTGSDDQQAKASVSSKPKTAARGGKTVTFGKAKPLAKGPKRMSDAHSRAGFVNCPTCANRFPNASSLNCHMRKDHGAKPYKCGECSETFGRKTEEVAHRNSVHGK